MAKEEHLNKGDMIWFEKYGYLKWLPDYNDDDWEALPKEKDQWGLVYEIVTNGKEIRFITRGGTGNWYGF